MEVRGRTPELISFRLNPGLGKTDSETKSNVLGGPDAKFGVPPDQIVEAYTKARARRAACQRGCTSARTLAGRKVAPGGVTRVARPAVACRPRRRAQRASAST